MTFAINLLNILKKATAVWPNADEPKPILKLFGDVDFDKRTPVWRKNAKLYIVR
jgi:hypothetical protein